MSKEAARSQWGSQIEFVLSTVGFAIDLANVWRFPYLCFKYGGGAFLIPYIVMNIFQAAPLLYLELSLGQTQQKGCVEIWNVVPAARGIGIAQCLMNLGMFYYNVIIGWCIFYFFNSFTAGELPWMSCGHSFNTEWCRNVSEFSNLTAMNMTGNSVLSATEFFERGVLSVHESPGVHSLGSPKFVLAGCNFIGFAILFFALFRGVQSFGKVVYITAILPVVLLIVLLINGLMLPGARNGVEFFINPKLDRINDIFAWVEAAIQVFYSTGAGFGVHLTLSSYSKRSNNCYRDALITIFANAVFSFLSGFVVFAYLGYMANITGRLVEAVAVEGPGLVFQVYPLAIGTLPLPQLWSALFFLMLINLGLDSSMGGVESVLTGIGDLLKKFSCFSGKYFRPVFTGSYLLMYFGLSLLLATPGGIYLWNIQNNFVPGLSLIFIAFSKAVAIAWLYGLDDFCSDLKRSFGISPGIFWRICWKFISPAFILAIIIVTIIGSVDLTSYLYFYPYTMYHPELFPNRTADGAYLYFYPESTRAVGWALTIVQIGAIFLFFLVAVVQYKSFWKAITPIWQHQLLDEGQCKRAKISHWLSLGPPTAWPLNHCCKQRLRDYQDQQQQQMQVQQPQMHYSNAGYANDKADAQNFPAANAAAIEVHYQ